MKTIMDTIKNEIFIKRAKEIHGDKYDYSLINYVNNQTKVNILCPKHGIFAQEPRKHINRKQTCPKCTGHHSDTKTFIEKANIKHSNKYDYSLVEYINAKTNVKIICPTHGVFEQTPNNHLRGKNCFQCTGTPKKTTHEFICDAIKIHRNKYDYSLVNYINSKTKINIICNKHGVFNQIPASHLNGSGCPICKESSGEKSIRYFLIDKNITFKTQHKFNDCKNIFELIFDFYIPQYNICIEYQGIQHFEPSSFFGGVIEFEKRKLNDKIKIEYCEKKNITLIHINYFDNITVCMSNLFKAYIFE
jgi:hypothetical protein